MSKLNLPLNPFDVLFLATEMNINDLLLIQIDYVGQEMLYFVYNIPFFLCASRSRSLSKSVLSQSFSFGTPAERVMPLLD